MKHIVAINGSPRKGWNTAMLVNDAADGAREAGAEVELFDLYKLDAFTGCISCFGCKRPQSLGKCSYRDGLTPVLDAIRKSDGLIIGSPNYLGNISAVTRSLYERLIFQLITYKTEPTCYAEKRIPVLFIMTSNCPEDSYHAFGYDAMIEGYVKNFEGLIGPTKTLIAGDTLQVKDYSGYGWTLFDPEKKHRSRHQDFPLKRQEARNLGKSLAEDWQ